jgi:hypothetical protein
MEGVVYGKETVELIQSPLHGTGVQVKKSISKGEILFRETPSLFLQSLPNRQDVIVCASCARYVGTCGTQLLLLTREMSRHEYVHDTPAFHGDILLAPIFPCFHQCGEVYCSEKCRSHHYETQHRLLCTGLISEVRLIAPLRGSHFPLCRKKQNSIP